MTNEILSEREIEFFVGSWNLIPGTGGVFDVTVNDTLVFSKKQLGRHAEEGEIRELILKELDKVRPADFVVPARK